jgi:enamine deaminase RidA (YjgF/YER057c/UK114 family)
VQATEAAGVVFVSGQLAARADGGSLADQPFEIQARQALANIIAIVEGAGLGRDRIAKVTAYLVGVEHWPAFNAIYAEVLGDYRPARAVVPVPALHHGYLIELEAIAVR